MIIGHIQNRLIGVNNRYIKDTYEKIFIFAYRNPLIGEITLKHFLTLLSNVNGGGNLYYYEKRLAQSLIFMVLMLNLLTFGLP